ncbi:hypothetical protein JTF06_01045 [Desemzia sp. RIT804]|uniref:hypothetical protein n=1 Tax=Desemzia sp. RIT 804 TaxID=2810209 RepID=UPI0019516597|nr:hypothetical protein [Desemzia sp. RIT 804]MBM6613476.1 hypothetical protein [Desemzia sp. RIT 804]
MTMEEMKNQLNNLVSGEQSEVVVEKEDFMVFLKLWNEHPEKNSIVGIAELGGKVIYRYKNEEIPT